MKKKQVKKMLSGIEHDLGMLGGMVEEIQERLASDRIADETVQEEKALGLSADGEPEPEPTMLPNELSIYVTQQQAKYMSDGDCWILGFDRSNSWLFVGNGQVDPYAEGNGVWVDAAGQEHYGPTG